MSCQTFMADLGQDRFCDRCGLAPSNKWGQRYRTLLPTPPRHTHAEDQHLCEPCADDALAGPDAQAARDRAADDRR